MNIFKKLFGKKKKQSSAEKDGCWHDNTNEQTTPRWTTPEADGVPWSDNSVDNNITMQLAKK